MPYGKLIIGGILPLRMHQKLTMVGKNIILYPETEYLDHALRISLSNKLTTYDSLYIALALKEKSHLLHLIKYKLR